MMIESQQMVQEFHETFDIPVESIPMIPSEKVKSLRVKLIQEELNELEEALDNNDMVEVADALGDILYVVFGSAVSIGINVEPIFNEVHRSNMTKVGGHKNEDGKWIKPATYERPNLVPILLAQGWKP
jgi:predicted HAD superfamily Cof-like phosphohydrolase